MPFHKLPAYPKLDLVWLLKDGEGRGDALDHPYIDSQVSALS